MKRLHLNFGPHSLGQKKFTPENSQRLREEFKTIVTQLSLLNAENKIWWYTWLSSRDRFNSILWAQLVARYQAELTLSHAPSDTEILTDDPLVAKSIEKIAQAQDWTVSTSLNNRLKWQLKRLKNRVLAFICLLKIFAKSWRWIVAAKSNSTASIKNVKMADSIFVSVADVASLDSHGAFVDHYFGEFPEQLASQGKKIVVVFIPTGSPGDICRALTQKQSTAILVSLAEFVKLSDLFKNLLLTFFRSNFRHTISDISPSLEAILKQDFRNAASNIFEGMIIETAMSRLLKLSPEAHITHIYENNPWERAIAQSANKSQFRHELTGYLHCAVLESHLKNYINHQEIVLRPAPNKIVCTGPAAREIFLRLGDHDPNKVIAGCALRGQNIASLSIRETPPKKISCALVILEGLPSMVQLLKFLEQAAQICSEVVFEFREHPALPLSVLMPNTDFRKSPRGSLEECLKKYDIAIYQGTTGAMTAVAMGIPVIKVDLEQSVNDDPLIDCTSLKKVVENPQDIKQAIAEFEAMSDDTFSEEAATARKYVENYLAPPSPETLRPFTGEPLIR